ncbi:MULTISPECIES: hypothetical protein [unclassified Pseudofrankia]|uniref:hypothetical protein n=1 Tax=unclassified Pseudofrankia TaxID=2994372 RepID=UPI0010420788|nr:MULTISPECIES: hypothetical protein [unclassified Pseudofrankia]
MVANPWLFDSGVDEAIDALLTVARRQGDGRRAERLERGRSALRRCREYGAERALIRDVLDRIESLGPTELADAVRVVTDEDLQAELRRRIDGAIDIGDVLAWDHWLSVSIALEQAGGPHSSQVVAPAGIAWDDAERDVWWARQFLDEHDVEGQRQMLRDGTLPLSRSRLERVRLRFRAAHLIAARERDALEVIHLRRSLAMAQVAAEADRDPGLAEEVLAGRQDVFVEGYVL